VPNYGGHRNNILLFIHTSVIHTYIDARQHENNVRNIIYLA